MTLHARDQQVTISPGNPLLMGIVNVNDDSFSDDGSLDPAWIRDRIPATVREGADIVDLGAESARTNRPPISEAEEIDRLLPAIAAFSAAFPADKLAANPRPLLSINSWRSAVAETVLPIAGDILNDMSGLPSPANAEICARAGAALLIMHLRGQPKVAQTHVTYPDIIDNLLAFFESRVAIATRAGLSPQQIILDPGIDFAKQRDDNLTILRNLARLAALGFPVLVPISRKTVIGDVLNLPNPRDRDPGTIACLVASALRGAAILRVHNVHAARQALTTLNALNIPNTCR